MRDIGLMSVSPLSNKKFCETGRDLDFAKEAQYLKPIRKPPFYAIFGHRWSQCTKGRNGIAVNPKFEVLNKKGKVMTGLYAAGDGCTIFGGLVLNKPIIMGAFGAEVASAPSAPGAGAPGGAASKNILEEEGSPCGGLGPAFISGYYAGINAGNFIKNI